LLLDLKARLALSYIFISHDLSVVEHMSDEVAVMYLGHIVERGSSETLFSNPRHPYTQALVSSVLDPDPRNKREHAPIKGDPAGPEITPSGCRFHPRCSFAMDICRQIPPSRTLLPCRGEVECFLYERSAVPDLQTV
jgi:oligopeptide/dipeptide ABC transporter ATP-binding protein